MRSSPYRTLGFLALAGAVVASGIHLAAVAGRTPLGIGPVFFLFPILPFLLLPGLYFLFVPAESEGEHASGATAT